MGRTLCLSIVESDAAPATRGECEVRAATGKGGDVNFKLGLVGEQDGHEQWVSGPADSGETAEGDFHQAR